MSTTNKNYFWRNWFRKLSNETQTVKDMTAKQIGCEGGFTELETKAKAEASDNELESVKSSRAKREELQRAADEAAAEESRALGLENHRETLTKKIVEVTEDISNLEDRLKNHPSEVASAKQYLEDCFINNFGESSSYNIQNKAAMLDFVSHAPAVEEAITGAIRRQRNTLKALREELGSIK